MSFILEEITQTETDILIYSESKPKKVLINGNELKISEVGNNYWRYDEDLNEIVINIKFNKNDEKKIDIVI